MTKKKTKKPKVVKAWALKWGTPPEHGHHLFGHPTHLFDTRMAAADFAGRICPGGLRAVRVEIREVP